MENTQMGAEGNQAQNAGLPIPENLNAPAKTEPKAAPASAAPASPATPEKVYYLGDKKFTSESDLLAYSASLQEKAQNYDKLAGQFQPQQEPVNKKKLADLIFEDTEAAIQEIRTQVKTEIQQEHEMQARQQNLVNTFYGQNPDLKGYEDIVDVIAFKMQKELANVPESERISKVATAVRKRLATIKGAQVSTEELSSSPAVTMGAGSGKPTVTTGAAKAPKSFAEQIREIQKRGKITKA